MSKKPISSEPTPLEPIPRKKPRKRKVTLSDGSVVEIDDNQKDNAKKGKTTKHINPPKQFSTETGKDYEDYKVVDKYDKTLDHKPPSKHPLFRKIWAETLPSLTTRENFNESHLGLLEVYCRLRVELRTLDDFVVRNGHTFRVISVLGEHRKTYPEIQERMKVLSQLATYSRMLDLLPKKDKLRTPKKEEKEEWK